MEVYSENVNRFASSKLTQTILIHFTWFFKAILSISLLRFCYFIVKKDKILYTYIAYTNIKH